MILLRNSHSFCKSFFNLIAFGDDAINRNFGHAEVIEQLEEFSDDSLKWDSIPDEDKEEWEEAYNEGAYLLMEHYND